MKVSDVYFVRFPFKNGREFYGDHYGVILTPNLNGTVLIAPITSKKSGKKYRGGITIITSKYQKNPTHDKIYIYTRKIQEVDVRKIKSSKTGFQPLYSLDDEDYKR